jgi:hypothetical protein
MYNPQRLRHKEFDGDLDSKKSHYIHSKLMQ